MSKTSLFQVQLEHGGGHKEAGPWEVNIDHTSTKCEEAETIMLVATVTGEGSRLQMLSVHVLCTAVHKEENFLQSVVNCKEVESLLVETTVTREF
jgi:hypothetical protein